MFNESFNSSSSLGQGPGVGTVPWKNNQNKEIVYHLAELLHLDGKLALKFVLVS